MSRKTHHVVPSSSGGWNVKRGGAERASGHFVKKIDAINFGRTVSQNQGTEFLIHKLNGQISQSDSHGRDPYPPRG